MSNMKKLIITCTIFILVASMLTGCAKKSTAGINVVSREDGSGTRGAFTEIVGLLEEKGDEKLDLTTEEAIVQNSTDGVMTTVKGDKNAIGYISTGSLNDTVKALKIEGVVANQENIKSGDYKISRPFLVTYKEGLKDIQKDFLNFLESKDADKIVEEEGYVAVGNDKDYKSQNLKGKITISGSTSVTPVMEKLKEAYESVNPQVTIEIQSTGSSAGISATIEGTSDFGMSSRELKSEEKAKLESMKLAIDGIAVIVNKEAEVEDISIDHVKDIFKGDLTTWDDLKN